MIKNFYLIVSNTGKIRTATLRPATNYNEVAISMTLNIPDAIFKRPQLEAVVNIPDSAINEKPITAQVTDNIKKIFAEQTGLELKITVNEAG